MKKKVILIILGIFIMFNPVLAEDPQKITLKFYPENDKSGKPFCEAVQVGNMLVLSGKIGTDPGTGKLAPGGIKGETKQIMDNIKATLEKYGSSIDHVFKCTVMLADIKEWKAFNEVYITFFKNNKPARSAFGTSGLAFNSRVEVECWAVLK